MLDQDVITAGLTTIFQRAPTEQEVAFFTENFTTERAAFVAAADSSAADISGTVVSLYQVFFGRVPEQAGLEFWGPLSTGGAFNNASGDFDPFALGAQFDTSAEFTEQFAGSSNAVIVTTLFQENFGREADPEGLAFWTDQLNAGNITVSEFGTFVATSVEFQALNGGLVDNYLVSAAEGTQDFEGSLFDEGLDASVSFGPDGGAGGTGDLDGDGDIDRVLLSVNTAPGATGINGASEDAPIVVTGEEGEVTTLRLTGDADIRIDLTDPREIVEQLDLDGDGIQQGETDFNVRDLLDISFFENIDAHPRGAALLDPTDSANGFTGDLFFDGTGFDADGFDSDGNIVLGGYGADVIFTGNGNDFVSSGGLDDNIKTGRNADFIYQELSRLDDDFSGDDGEIDGGATFDDDEAQDSDWLLLEASDDEEPVTVTLQGTGPLNITPGETGVDLDAALAQLVASEDLGTISTRLGNDAASIQNIENVNASGNFYGFFDTAVTEITSLAYIGAGTVNNPLEDFDEAAGGIDGFEFFGSINGSAFIVDVNTSTALTITGVDSGGNTVTFENVTLADVTALDSDFDNGIIGLRDFTQAAFDATLGLDADGNSFVSVPGAGDTFPDVFNDPDLSPEFGPADTNPELNVPNPGPIVLVEAVEGSGVLFTDNPDVTASAEDDFVRGDTLAPVDVEFPGSDLFFGDNRDFSVEEIDFRVPGRSPGVTAQSVIVGSDADSGVGNIDGVPVGTLTEDGNNILIAGFDNDFVAGLSGDDLLFGEDLEYLLTHRHNPNLFDTSDGTISVNATEDGVADGGRDTLVGGSGSDNIVWEADEGAYLGDSDSSGGSAIEGLDTLWLTTFSVGRTDDVVQSTDGSRTDFLAVNPTTGAPADQDLTGEGERTDELAALNAITTDFTLRFDLGMGAGFDYQGNGDDLPFRGDLQGADVVGTADQTNYASGFDRTAVVDIENINASGLGAIDYVAAGVPGIDGADFTPNVDLQFENQQNYRGTNSDLDLRGIDLLESVSPGLTGAGVTGSSSALDADFTTGRLAAEFNTGFIRADGSSVGDLTYTTVGDGSAPSIATTSAGETIAENSLFASRGDDVLEGRGGDDFLEGREGDDIFIVSTNDDVTGGSIVSGQPGAQVSFVVDGSASLSVDEFDDEVSVVQGLIDDLRMDFSATDNVVIQLVQFGVIADSATFNLFDPALDDITTGTPLSTFQAGGGTNYAPALQEAVNFFSTPGTLVFLSDGEPSDPFDAQVADLDAAGVSRIAVGFGGASLTTLDQIDNTGGAQLFGSAIDIDIDITPNVSVSFGNTPFGDDINIIARREDELTLNEDGSISAGPDGLVDTIGGDIVVGQDFRPDLVDNPDVVTPIANIQFVPIGPDLKQPGVPAIWTTVDELEIVLPGDTDPTEFEVTFTSFSGADGNAIAQPDAVTAIAATLNTIFPNAGFIVDVPGGSTANFGTNRVFSNVARDDPDTEDNETDPGVLDAVIIEFVEGDLTAAEFAALVNLDINFDSDASDFGNSAFAVDVVLDSIIDPAPDLREDDELVFRSYQNRFDDESVPDRQVSLGREAYAEDLVVGVQDGTTKLVEGQEYRIFFDDLKENDTVSLTLNGQTYSRTVDFSSGNTSETTEAFLQAFADQINATIAADPHSRDGQIAVTFSDATPGDTNSGSLVIREAEFAKDVAEHVFIQFPVVDVTNASGGDAPNVVIKETSDTSVVLFDYDFRSAETDGLNRGVGVNEQRGDALDDRFITFEDTFGLNRAILQDADFGGETFEGLDVTTFVFPDNFTPDEVVFDPADLNELTLQSIIATPQEEGFLLETETTVPGNGGGSLGQPDAGGFTALHGDDLLIGRDGTDTILGRTGDDRIIASRTATVSSTDREFINGGANIVVDATTGTIQEAAFEGLTGLLPDGSPVASDSGLQQTAGTGETLLKFVDTLLLQEGIDTNGNDVFNENSLFDIFITGVAEDFSLTGTVQVDEGPIPDGIVEHYIDFTNIEIVRTLSDTQADDLIFTVSDDVLYDAGAIQFSTTEHAFVYGVESVTTGVGDDIIIGTVQDEVLSAGSGDDTLNGGDGDDVVNGEAGDDTLFELDLDIDGDTTSDFLDDGDDSYSGGEDDDVFHIVLNNGDGGDDTFAGNEDDDVFNIAGGADVTIDIDDCDFDALNDGDVDVDTFDGGSGFDIINLAAFDASEASIAFAADSEDTGDETVTIDVTVLGADADGNVSSIRREVTVPVGSQSNTADPAAVASVVRSALAAAGFALAPTGVTITGFDGDSEDDGFDTTVGVVVNSVVVDDDSAESDGDPLIATVTDTGSDSVVDLSASAVNDVEQLFLNGRTVAISESTFDLSGDIQILGAGTIVVVDGDGDGEIFTSLDDGNFEDGVPLAEIVIAGTDAAETLTGTQFDDLILGKGGDDIIDGAEGDDEIDGGDGDDIIDGGDGIDDILGGDGDDTIDGGDETEADEPDGDADPATPGDGDGIIEVGDVIDGGAGDDLINGEGGADDILGGSGDDEIDGGDDDDIIDGGDDSDLITGGNGDDVLNGGAGNDVVNGNAGDDFVDGDEGADAVDTGSGFDFIAIETADSNIVTGADTITNFDTDEDQDGGTDTDAGDDTFDTILLEGFVAALDADVFDSDGAFFTVGDILGADGAAYIFRESGGSTQFIFDSNGNDILDADGTDAVFIFGSTARSALSTDGADPVADGTDDNILEADDVNAIFDELILV
ncbi:MAG: DUF4214 domain-containing protein [Pseudomonadota bacterium]